MPQGGRGGLAHPPDRQGNCIVSEISHRKDAFLLNELNYMARLGAGRKGPEAWLI